MLLPVTIATRLNDYACALFSDADQSWVLARTQARERVRLLSSTAAMGSQRASTCCAVVQSACAWDHPGITAHIGPAVRLPVLAWVWLVKFDQCNSAHMYM